MPLIISTLEYVSVSAQIAEDLGSVVLQDCATVAGYIVMAETGEHAGRRFRPDLGRLSAHMRLDAAIERWKARGGSKAVIAFLAGCIELKDGPRPADPVGMHGTNVYHATVSYLTPHGIDRKVTIDVEADNEQAAIARAVTQIKRSTKHRSRRVTATVVPVGSFVQDAAA